MARAVELILIRCDATSKGKNMIFSRLFELILVENKDKKQGNRHPTQNEWEGGERCGDVGREEGGTSEKNN